MKLLSQNTPIKHNQSGIASILVTMIMMIVLTLIVLGFATISRREETNALNNQLSSQAFYAAETGVNDAQQVISAQLATGALILSKNDCGTDPNYQGTLTSGSNQTDLNQIDTAANISYSCLLINPTPPDLEYADISSSSTVIPINSSTNASIGSLKLQWRAANEDTTSGTDFAQGCPTTASQTLPSGSSWAASGCKYGMLRVEIVPTDQADLSSANLLNDEMTFYLSPVFGVAQPATTVNYSGCAAGSPSTVNQCGAIIEDQCLDGGASVAGTYCQATIHGLNLSNYTLRVQSLYNDSGLNVTPGNASLTGAQVLVDSTGQAQGVLRRIQVRFKLTSSGSTPIPDEAIEAGGNICDRFVVSGGYFVDDTNGVCAGEAYVTPPPPGNATIFPCNANSPPSAQCPAPPYNTKQRSFYDAYIYNESNNPGLTVVACTWYWGDGTTTSGSAASGTLDSAACEPGDPIDHCYPYYVTAYYTVKLTVYLSNGSSGTTESGASEPNTTNWYDPASTVCSVPAS
jgi:hypothetical protein